MTTDRFDIKGSGDGWAIHHAGDVSIEYATKEAALEAAAVAGTNALRLGNGLIISVDPAKESEDVMGVDGPKLADS